MTYKLVRFHNGKYGIRTYWFFGWHFLDLVSEGYHWRRCDKFFSHCQADKETAMQKSSDYEIVEQQP